MTTKKNFSNRIYQQIESNLNHDIARRWVFTMKMIIRFVKIWNNLNSWLVDVILSFGTKKNPSLWELPIFKSVRLSDLSSHLSFLKTANNATKLQSRSDVLKANQFKIDIMTFFDLSQDTKFKNMFVWSSSERTWRRRLNLLIELYNEDKKTHSTSLIDYINNTPDVYTKLMWLYRDRFWSITRFELFAEKNIGKDFGIKYYDRYDSTANEYFEFESINDELNFLLDKFNWTLNTKISNKDFSYLKGAKQLIFAVKLLNNKTCKISLSIYETTRFSTQAFEKTITTNISTLFELMKKLSDGHWDFSDYFYSF